MLFDLFRSSTEAIRTSKSAVQPALWACIFVSVPFGFLASRAADWTRFLYLGMAAAPVALFIFQGIYFTLKDPGRLHSEEHQIRSRILDIVESKGGDIKVSPFELTSIANPHPEPKKLPGKGDK